MIEQKYNHQEIKWYTRLFPWFWMNNIDNPMPPGRFKNIYDASWVVRVSKYVLPYKAAVKLWWFIRNPFHNFTRYTIGFCGRDITVYSKYPGEMFAPMGFNWFIVKWKWLFFPGLSYYGKKWRWYAGWLDSGQFGLEFREI